VEKTGVKETVALFVILIISRVSLHAISGFVHNSGTAAAINALCGVLIAVLVCLISGSAFKKTSFTEAFTISYGKIPGSIVLILFLIVTLINASHRMQIFGDAIGEFILNDTPRMYILLIFGVCVYAAAYSGIETITRYSISVIAAFFVFLTIILLSAHGEVSYVNICPILGKGSFYNVFNMLYVFADIIYMYFVFEGIKGAKAKNVLSVVLIGGIVAVVLTLFYTLCIPYPVSEEFSFPLYRLASLANSTVVFQRLDGLVFLIWIFTGFISAGALTLFASMLLAKIARLSDRRAVVPSVTFIVFLMSYILDGDFIDVVMSIFAFLILPLTALLLKIKENRACAKK